MGLALPLLIGLALGIIAALFGAGGGVVAVPLFVLALGLANPVATGTSLGVITVAALVGTTLQARAGLVHWRAALWLAPTAMLGAQVGARLNPLAPQAFTLSCFVVLLLAAAVRMARAKEPEDSEAAPQVQLQRGALAGLGLVAGVVIGFLGVSGGFVVVPVLRTLVKLPMKRATATSLAVMSASSASGAVGFALQGLVQVDVLLPAGAGAFAGALLGVALSRRLKAELLRKAFVVLALAIAARVAWSVVGLLRA
jgi:uncharacterized membrane protein YfcA